MPTPDSRFLPVAILLLAGLQIGLPWADGGRSPAGQASLVLLLAFAGAAGLLPRGAGTLPRPSPLLLLAALLAGVSAVHTIYPDRTVQSLLLLSAYLLAGSVAARGAREVPWAERMLLTAIFTSGAAVCGVGMFHLVRGNEGGMYANVLTGPFGYPNALAGFLLLAAGAALAIALGDHNPVLRGAATVAGILSGVGVLLTRARGALLAAAVGFAVWAVIRRQAWWSRRRLWVWLGIVGLLGLSAVALSPVGSTLLRGFRPDVAGLADTSLLWRWQILRWTWAMVRDHPWWGVGPGAFPVALGHYQRIPYVSGENPHNLYLELTAEYGLPAGILVVLSLAGFLGKVGARIRRLPPEHPDRHHLAALMAALTAFLAHSTVDLDWSFPAIALAGATLLGLASAHLRTDCSLRPRATPAWRAAISILLVAAAVVALTRYYAGTLITWARFALTAGETTAAQKELTWALRLNPISFPAHQWMARARIQTGDLWEAVAVSERAVRIAPADPNSLFLAGEVAAASARWDAAQTWFRSAVERAPAAQLRFYAGLVESYARGGKGLEARWWYERAATIFSPEQVLESEARCLAPGDRYLLARMSRIAAQSYAEASHRGRQQALLDRAQFLAQPDPRGICISGGRPGQTSPEVAVENFWRALGEGGWPQAQRFLVPDIARSRSQDVHRGWESSEGLVRARQVRIAALSGGERRVSLRSEVEFELLDGRRTPRCTRTDLRPVGDGWFLENIPFVELGPCR
ncbi:MAG: O-antigen ligase family protein [candidate division NC10 bacterium]|nr:O-antigen ligase family protein [candidate division NC10 bacterium]